MQRKVWLDTSMLKVLSGTLSETARAQPARVRGRGKLVLVHDARAQEAPRPQRTHRDTTLTLKRVR